MQKTLPLSLLFVGATVLTSNAAILWTVGREDDIWEFTAANPGNGGGANATFVQEAGINPLPGNPNNPELDVQADDDYYFAGLYSTVIPSNGVYSPVALVNANEEVMERAFAGTDNEKRFHFNLPVTLLPNDKLSISFDAVNFDGNGSSPRYGVEMYFNNVLVMSQVIVSQLDLKITSPEFTLASVGAQTGAGPDNIVTLRGINYSTANGGNWMGIDYVQLDSNPVPEPSTGLGLLVGAVGLTPFLRRRRR